MILNRAKCMVKIKAKKVKEYYAKHGLLRMITYYLTGMFYRSSNTIIFFELELDNLRFSHLKDEHGIEYIKIEKENFDTLDHHGWGISKEEALNNLDEGCVLFVGVDEETVVSRHWCEMKMANLFGLELTVNLPGNTGYISHLYTDPMHRGKGIGTYTKANTLKYLKEVGYTRALAIIDEKNVASLSVNDKFGFKAYQTVTLYRFLFIIKYYRVKDYASKDEKNFLLFKKDDQKLWRFFSKIHIC